MRIGLGAFGRGQLHFTQAAAQLRGQHGGGFGPVGLQIEHMGCVGRGKSCHLHQALFLQGNDGALRVQRCGELAQGLGRLGHQAQDFGLARGQLGGLHAGFCTKGQQYKAPMHGAAAVHVRQIGLQHGQHLGVARAQQGHGHDALGVDGEFARHAQRHFAVAAQADGAHVNSAHHGAPAAHFGALFVHARPTVDQHAQIGGGAAHVGHDETLQAREPLRAHQTGRRARKHGLNRPGGHALRQRQAAVALDDH